jgi:hypothetical protein
MEGDSENLRDVRDSPVHFWSASMVCQEDNLEEREMRFGNLIGGVDVGGGGIWVRGVFDMSRVSSLACQLESQM